MDTNPRCETCGRPLVRGRLTDYDVSDLVGFQRVIVDGADALVCADGHETKIIAGDVIDLVAATVAGAIIQHIPRTGAEVRFLRKFLDLTQQDLGESLGVDRNTVSRWESWGSSRADAVEIPVASAQAIRGRVAVHLMAVHPKLAQPADAERWFREPAPTPRPSKPYRVGASVVAPG
jgi:DNA-binding transcriptional regulator YiaG